MLCTEEILSSTEALWWSPDSRFICYAAFNDTKVPLFRFPYYGHRSDLYGDIIEFAYPKVSNLAQLFSLVYFGCSKPTDDRWLRDLGYVHFWVIISVNCGLIIQSSAEWKTTQPEVTTGN